MPTILSHAAVPLAIGLGLGSKAISRRLLLAGVVASALPDLDVVAFRLGVAYTDSFGHRGASHSLAAAVLLGVIAALFASRLQTHRRVAFAFVALSAASHGLLDMLTNGGRGVALWWPLSDERFFFPWQVVEASPLSLRRVFSGRGLEVLQTEIVWIWLPAALVTGSLLSWRRRRSGT
jgi:inner membrane protein